MITKSEKREKKRRNRSKMIVDGRSLFTIVRIKINKANNKKNGVQKI
jgi:hypothetical protein